MTGNIIIITGISLVVLGTILFIGSFVYKNTTGKKIINELNTEY